MKGVNQITFSGNAGDAPYVGEIPGGGRACAFELAQSYRRGQTTWARINVYTQEHIDVCVAEIEKGTYVIVSGELMNRQHQGRRVLEILARDIIVVNKEQAA